ncbi:hypothetical protein CONCODRAFT_11584 [Conidiobolus coronatus NRRL 28638]|uniref:Uncharacterized protein n=1 Tax=Conidiobolus coronatus (strain ATCC 28846 / CBS 209.66 / NRRL 28638) TaxID=796925 RepID=A0A137NUT3_CONC2|nr:hypothetical protein CONCODRAFT_11584 [Conidiobolus coronatus NRRL 28638]|eukprot:KXN66540.1 hypothetical protein CONCODRAFT_11584 [Conidiobolus coronatus NRRL 28638]
MELVLNECGADFSTNDSIEFGKDIQMYGSRQTQSESSHNSDKASISLYSMETSSLTNTFKFQKFLSILKISLIILIYNLEIIPYYSIQTYFSIINNTEGISELSVQVALLLADLIPLTNTFLILFIHEETWQELRLWVVVWGNRVKKRF